VSLALALALALGASPAAADAKKDAQLLYDDGLKQLKAGDAKSALVSLRASYEKLANPKVLYSIAQLCTKMGDGACAVRAYQQYLREGGKEITPKKKKEVDGEIRALSKTLGSVVIKSTVMAAEVSIDDVPVGKTPLSEAVPMNGGPHKVVLVSKEKGTIEQMVNVVAGDVSTVHLDPKEDATAAAPPASASIPEKKDKDEPKAELPPAPVEQQRPFPTVAWAITGGLAAGTLVTGIVAAVNYSSFQDTKEQIPVTRDELDAAQGSARDWFLVSAILGTGTLISAGISTWLTFSTTSNQPIKPEKSLRFGVGPRGITVTGVMW
jgi:PEGA domain